MEKEKNKYKYKKCSSIWLAILMCALISVSAHSAENIEQLQLDYNSQLSDFNKSKNELASIKADIDSSDARLKSLEKERNDASSSLEDIQKLDRENPGLGLADKVQIARERNTKAYTNYNNEANKLNGLNSDYISKENTLKKQANSLNAVANRIKISRDEVVSSEAEKRIATFKKSTSVEGYAEVGCGEESPRKCQQRARRAAERDASEKGSVVIIQSATKIENFQLTDDLVKTEVKAQLSDVEILKKGWLGDTTYQYHIKATVTPIIGASLRRQLEESIAHEKGIVVPPPVLIAGASTAVAVTPVAVSPAAPFSADASFDELDRETSGKPSSIEEDERRQRERFAAQRANIESVPVPNEGIESWYTLWGLGFAGIAYPDWIEESFDVLEEAGGDRTKLAIQLFGFYAPVNRTTLVGGIISGTSDSVVFPDDSSFSVTTSLLAVSAIKFLTNKIGHGLYVRGDLGLAGVSRQIKSELVDIEEQSNTGFGLLAGLGYSLAVSDESRMLFSINYTQSSVEGEEYSAGTFMISGLW